MKKETDGAEATLLLVMTIIGRIISGIHGQMSLDRGEDTLSAFTFMESSVFILEDGAAILFLAKRGNVEGFLEEASMYLTVVCGVGFMITWTMIVISQCFRCNSSLPTASLSTLLVPLGFATYLGFILTTETSLFGKIPDDNLIDTKDFVIYGIASAYMILISLEMYLRVEIVDSSDSSDHSEKSDGSPI